jgi:hypothetical protein
MQRTTPILLAALVLAACEPVPDTPVTEMTASPLPVVRLAADSTTFAITSGYETPATLVIRDSTAWAAAWATLHGEADPHPALPTLDFTTDMLVLVAIGQQPNGGHGVFITSASYDSTGAVVVRADHRMPGSTCMTTMELVQPVDIAKVPRSEVEVRFEVTPVTQECPP